MLLGSSNVYVVTLNRCSPNSLHNTRHSLRGWFDHFWSMDLRHHAKIVTYWRGLSLVSARVPLLEDQLHSHWRWPSSQIARSKYQSRTLHTGCCINKVHFSLLLVVRPPSDIHLRVWRSLAYVGSASVHCSPLLCPTRPGRPNRTSCITVGLIWWTRYSVQCSHRRIKMISFSWCHPTSASAAGSSHVSGTGIAFGGSQRN